MATSYRYSRPNLRVAHLGPSQVATALCVVVLLAYGLSLCWTEDYEADERIDVRPRMPEARSFTTSAMNDRAAIAWRQPKRTVSVGGESPEHAPTPARVGAQSNSLLPARLVAGSSFQATAAESGPAPRHAPAQTDAPITPTVGAYTLVQTERQAFFDAAWAINPTIADAMSLYVDAFTSKCGFMLSIRDVLQRTSGLHGDAAFWHIQQGVYQEDVSLIDSGFAGIQCHGGYRSVNVEMSSEERTLLY